MEHITIALSKGRLANKILDIINRSGLSDIKIEEDTRKLVITSSDNKFSFFLAKPSDVPTYVDYGIADLGVVGKDTIDEEMRDITELLDLGFGKCRMCVCGFKDKNPLDKGQIIRVATKYPHIAQAYFERTLRRAEIIKLNGSVELGPIVGLSDVIVDIVETGTTLKENGLEVLEVIEDLSCRLIGNNASIRNKYNSIMGFIDVLKGELND